MSGMQVKVQLSNWALCFTDSKSIKDQTELGTFCSLESRNLGGKNGWPCSHFVILHFSALLIFCSWTLLNRTEKKKRYTHKKNNMAPGAGRPEGSASKLKCSSLEWLPSSSSRNRQRKHSNPTLDASPTWGESFKTHVSDDTLRLSRAFFAGCRWLHGVCQTDWTGPRIIIQTQMSQRLSHETHAKELCAGPELDSLSMHVFFVSGGVCTVLLHTKSKIQHDFWMTGGF